VLDPASGATRAAIDVPQGHHLTLAGRHLVDPGESSPPVRTGCTAHVTGYTLDGAVVWRRAVKLGRDRSRRCDSYFATDAGGDVALTAAAGRALLLDAGTGRTIWKGPRGAWTYRGITATWLTWRRHAASDTACGEDGGAQSTVVLDGRTGRRVLTVPGVPKSFVPGARPGLMTRIDSSKRYAARYGFVTLPAP
jgi:hypothetical protein